MNPSNRMVNIAVVVFISVNGRFISFKRHREYLLFDVFAINIEMQQAQVVQCSMNGKKKYILHRLITILFKNPYLCCLKIQIIKVMNKF